MPFFDGMVAELFLGKDYFDNPSGMFWVQWLTRILVAAELVIGIALLQSKWFKNIVVPATLITLVLFTIHLFYEGFRQENGFIEGNCGCFGDVLPMTNLESIIKNIIGMALGIYVWLKYQKEDQFGSWVSPTLIGLVTLFTLNFGIKSYVSSATPAVVEDLAIIIDSIPFIDTIPVPDIEEITVKDLIEAERTDKEENSIPTPTSDIDQPEEIVTETPVVTKTPSDKTIELLNTYAPALQSLNLSSSTKLICLFSMTCSHCQEVYRDLSAMKASGKLPNIYLVNYGSEYEQNYFFTQAGNSEDPHTLIEDFTSFKRMLEGKTYPRLLYIKNGKTLKEWDVDSYDRASFMKYYGIEKLEEKKEGGLQLELNSGDSPW